MMMMMKMMMMMMMMVMIMMMMMMMMIMMMMMMMTTFRHVALKNVRLNYVIARDAGLECMLKPSEYSSMIVVWKESSNRFHTESGLFYHMVNVGLDNSLQTIDEKAATSALACQRMSQLLLQETSYRPYML